LDTSVFPDFGMASFLATSGFDLYQDGSMSVEPP